MSCPNCGASDESVIPVWEDKQRWEADEQPKFIGCTSCHRMMRYGLIFEYRKQDRTPPQAKLTDAEIERMKPLGNQNTERLTLIEWQAVKGAATYYGVSDWIQKVDHTLTCEENVALMRRNGTQNNSRTMKEMPELQ